MTTPRPAASDRNATVAAGFLGWTLDAFDFFLVVMTLTAIGKDFGKSDAAIALSLTLTLLFRPVGAFIFGLLADRYGRKTLIIWRKLTGNPEEDNLVLDEWFTKQGYSSKDSEFGLIYVNGGNNLENLKAPDDTWKVRLIEDDFQRLMFAE